MNWPMHRQWHKALKEQVKEQRDVYGAQTDRRQERMLQDLEGRPCSSFENEIRLLEMSGKSLRQMAKGYRAIIAKYPEEPAAYRNCAAVLEESGDYRGAFEMHMKTKGIVDTEASTEASTPFKVSLFEDGRNNGFYADTIGKCFEFLCCVELQDLPKPSWWNDSELLALSEQVVANGPSTSQNWMMRGTVLAGNYIETWKSLLGAVLIGGAQHDIQELLDSQIQRVKHTLAQSWGAGDRTVEQLCEGIRAFLRIVELEPSGSSMLLQAKELGQMLWLETGQKVIMEGFEAEIRKQGAFSVLWREQKTLGIYPLP